jgi:hypothetical protein
VLPEITTLRGPVAPPDAGALADRDAVLQLCRLYALSMDTRNEAMLLSLFSPDSVMHGVKGDAPGHVYLPKLLARTSAYSATMHSILNQYAVVEGDAANVHSYCVAYHIETPGNGRGDVDVGVIYMDRCERSPRGWWIVHREVTRVWTRTRPPQAAPA